MNKAVLSTLIVILLTVLACSSTTPQVQIPTFDPNSLSTSIAQTANAAFTQTAAQIPPTLTPTPTYIVLGFSIPSHTPIVTPTEYSSGSFRAGDPTATPLGSEITDPNFIKGLEAYKTEDFEKVIQFMNAAIELNPNLAPPYRYRGMAYFSFNDCESAMEDIEMALSINPEYAFAWGGHGVINMCLGNEAEGLADYQKALSLDPSLAFVHANLGVYYYSYGDYEKSLEEFTISTEIDSNRSGDWSGKAEALYQLGRYRECIVNATKALEINSEEWLAYQDRALCYDSVENYNESILDYKTYIEHDATDSIVWYDLGIAQKHIGDLEGALYSYSKALELNPDYYQAHINRGGVYNAMKEYKKALADFNAALEFGDIAFAYSGRGEAYYGLEQYDKAISDYKMALSLYPGRAYYYCMLSLSYFEIGEYQNSLDAGLASNEIDPSCGGQKLYETESRSYYALGNYEQALVYINKAFSMGEYALGHYYRGIIYQAAGKNQEAIQDLELFLSSNQSPESSQDEIKDAKTRLAKLKK